MPRSDEHNETSNTPGGINTPTERENNAATDPLSDAVAGMMDNIQSSIMGEGKEEGSARRGRQR